MILALTLVLSAEMFNQVLKALLLGFGRPVDDAARGLANRRRGRVCGHHRLCDRDRVDPGTGGRRHVRRRLKRALDVDSERQSFVVQSSQAGRTVLSALRDWLPGQSWSALRKLLVARRVLVNHACLDEARR